MESMAQFLHRTGRNEGLAEGRRELLVRLVERRFGELPPSAQDRISAADDPTLERWADRLFTAQTLTDLLEP